MADHILGKCAVEWGQVRDLEKCLGQWGVSMPLACRQSGALHLHTDRINLNYFIYIEIFNVLFILSIAYFK